MTDDAQWAGFVAKGLRTHSAEFPKLTVLSVIK